MDRFDALLDLADADTPGSYVGRAGVEWTIEGAVNGGAFIALAATALGRTFDAAGHHAEPIAVTGYYLSAGRPGQLRLDTEVVRAGRTMSTGQVSGRQTGEDGAPVERLRVLATFGDLSRADEDVRTKAVIPDIPAPDECVNPLTEGSAMPVPPFLSNFDLRFDPATVGWAAGRPSGVGEIRAWLRHADGHEPDLASILIALDALPPVSFDLGELGWTPTLELSCHVRARPAPGWLLVRISSVNLAGGYLEEDAEVWDSTGRLVGQSRQLARIALPHQRIA